MGSAAIAGPAERGKVDSHQGLGPQQLIEQRRSIPSVDRPDLLQPHLLKAPQSVVLHNLLDAIPDPAVNQAATLPWPRTLTQYDHAMEPVPTVTSAVPYRQVRAVYDENAIAVYQAYPPEIAEPALAAGTFVAPFGMTRMTWIKPSFLWMAYRSGWGSKPGQTRVLRIHIKRTGFEWALANSCLSHYDPKHHASEASWRSELRLSPVRVQWDPEQTIHMQPQPQIRSIQIGLSGDAVPLYVNDWINSIEDVTSTMHYLHQIARTAPADAAAQLPIELPYPLPEDIAKQVAATPFD